MRNGFKFLALFFVINIPFPVIAFPDSTAFEKNNFSNSSSPLGSRKKRTGFSSGWGLQNENPLDVDLSEWGGERPSCAIAPNCPVCIK